MTPRPQPVLVGGSISGLAAAAVPVLVGLGVSNADATRYVAFVGAALALLLAVYHLFSVRAQVTPLVSPVSANGIPLVEAVVNALEDGNAEDAPPPPVTAPATTTATAAAPVTTVIQGAPPPTS